MSGLYIPFFSSEESFIHIKIVGVGSDGCQYVDAMLAKEYSGVELIAIHSDAQTLKHSAARSQVLIGPKTARRVGAGYSSEIGRQAALESRREIAKALKGADMVFITAGMSGGTGTGAAPVIAQIASEAGALVIGVVTLPYEVEGTQRRQAAVQSVSDLLQCTDTLFAFSKEETLTPVKAQVSPKEISQKIETMIQKTVQGIIELILVPGLINLDFSDVRSILRKAGKGLVGFGEASEADRAQRAALQAVSGPALHDCIGRAKNVLMEFTGGPSLSLFEINQAAWIIRNKVGPDANMIFGSIVDPELGEKVCITLYATGIDPEETESRTSLRTEMTPSPNKVELPITETSMQVFLCHSSNDKATVRKLYQRLQNEKNIKPWLDEEELLPGQQWDLEIRRAVRNSDAVIICLSHSSVNKEGYIQKELRFALDIADEKPEGTIFIIPLKLDDCDVPERLRSWQWVNYYEEGAFERLIKSLRKRAETLNTRSN
ncbi:MAG: cell division protein FtsZ [Chloroflexota bacterium]|nr:cell division protein FtsZ [Anaerolineales bacterium]